MVRSRPYRTHQKGTHKRQNRHNNGREVPTRYHQGFHTESIRQMWKKTLKTPSKINSAFSELIDNIQANFHELISKPRCDLWLEWQETNKIDVKKDILKNKGSTRGKKSGKD